MLCSSINSMTLDIDICICMPFSLIKAVICAQYCHQVHVCITKAYTTSMVHIVFVIGT